MKFICEYIKFFSAYQICPYYYITSKVNCKTDILPYHKLNIVHEYKTFICISYFTILKCLVGINIQKFVHKKMYAITHAETYYKKVQERGNAKHISTIFTLLIDETFNLILTSSFSV